MPGRALADAGLRSGVCAIGSGLAMLAASRAVEAALGFDLGKPALVVQVAIAGGTGVVVFLGLARLLRIPELPTMLGLMRDALRRQAT